MTVVPTKWLHPLKIQPCTSKSSTSARTPPVPIGILWKSFPPKLPPPQKEVEKSLVNPNLKIPQTLPPLDLPPPDTKETIETYRPPDETFYQKPLPYNPMSYISADMKYMPKGIYDYEFLLIAVCEITGCMMAIPLIKHDVVSIAHALIDRVFLIFGPPKSLIVNETRALSSKVMHYVLDALKIDVKCISLYNHGSLKTERYIQTINNPTMRHLKDKGKEWPLFITSCYFAMNTFVSTTRGFSPYELVFLKKPSDILNLYFKPLETIAKRLQRLLYQNENKITLHFQFHNWTQNIS